MEERHGERKQQITVERLATFSGDLILRQVSEAFYIQELSPTMNCGVTKLWNQPKRPKTTQKDP